MRKVGAPSKSAKYKVQAAINVMERTTAKKFFCTESVKMEKIEWLKNHRDKRIKLIKDKSKDAKEKRKNLGRMFESKIKEYFYKSKDKGLMKAYEKEKDKLYDRHLKNKGKDNPQIRISRKSKDDLELIAKVTKLKSPARVINELLIIFESQPSILLDNIEINQHKKKKAKKRSKK